eukprot:CAMPEP_0185155210 /NCGR_PEP_ID=MMETSP1139-20130426/288_1 /TAXON_ID=298111 /ORGANISM="Pavlova sp., Strain CCMP459" /LENGTH=94 /DNA_ID=CAMNT_0027720097 /DNA_START=17 /DNA_END=301 /DNA_ORIENTATION=+
MTSPPAHHLAEKVANPCAVQGEKLRQHFSFASISTDAFFLDDAENTCSQICLPAGLEFIAKGHGVDFGHECTDLGYDTLVDRGNRSGVAYYVFM